MATFGKWLGDKLLLNHVVMHTNPWIYLFKCAVAIAVVLIFDQRVTKQPDSVTSLFTALLCLGPTVLLGSKAGMNIFFASMIGTMWGSLCTIVFHVRGDPVLHFDSYFLLMHTTDSAGNSVCASGNPHCSTYLWLLLARVPLGVCLTLYTLLVIRRSDPGSTATGVFSALYVQLLTQYWPYALRRPDTDFWVEKNVIATVIVRIVATLTGVIAATVVNGVVSGLFMRNIFAKRLEFIERDIRSNVDTIDTQSPAAQGLFNALFGFLGDLQLAQDEAKLRHMILLDRIIGDDREFLRGMERKVMAVFRLLSVQMFLSLASSMSQLDDGERQILKRMLQGSKKKTEIGFEDKHLLDDLDLDKYKPKHPEGIKFLKSIVVYFMDELTGHYDGKPPANGRELAPI